MQVETKVEILDGDRAKVTVTIDKQAIADLIKAQYKKVANQYTIPGFRKGKAPRPVIDSSFGKDYVRALVTDAVVNDNYPAAIDEAGLFPVGEPEFDEEAMELVEDGKDYVFTFEVNTKPTMKLSSYEPISIELPSEEVTEEQIDDEIETLLGHYQEIVNAPANTKVKEDNYVELKMTATDDKGEPIETLESESLQYGLGSDLLPKTFDDELLGLKKGDTKEFSIDMPTDVHAMTSSLMGKTAKINFNIEVLAVQKKKTPKLTDEWAREKIGVENVDELREELREEIAGQLSSIIPRMKEARVMTVLQDRLEGEVSDAVVEEQEAQLLQDFFTQLQRQGLTLDGYLKQQGITSDQFRDDVKLQAADVAKQDLALDAWAAEKGLEATEQDILDEFSKAGSDDPEKMVEEWRKSGRLHLIREGIMRQKAAQDVMDTAVVAVEESESKKKGAKKSKKAAGKSEDSGKDSAAESDEKDA